MSDLGGRRLLLTRTESGCRDWAEAIRARGGEPVPFPCIRVRELRDAATAASLRAALSEAAWLALSSSRAADIVADFLEDGLPPAVRVAVVGPATAAAAERRLGRVDLQAPGGTGRSLARALEPRLGPGERLVVAAAIEGRRDLEEILEPRDVEIVRIGIYRTEPAAESSTEPLPGGLDAILLASPSAVRGLTGRAGIDPGIDIVTIGPTTSAAVREAGLTVAAEARERSLEGMLEVLP